MLIHRGSGRPQNTKELGEKLRGFAIAGEDRQFYPGSAYIRDDGTVMVSSPKVPTPVAVRYGWAPNPDCNLVYKVRFSD